MPDMTVTGVIVSGGAKLINTTDSSVPTYAITEDSSTVTEGNSVSFTVATTNVADSTTLYWTVANYPLREDADFTATSGSFTVNSNSGSFNVAIATDGDTEGDEPFRVYVRTGSTTGPVVATSATVTISDGAWDPSTDITTVAWIDASDSSSYTRSGTQLTGVTDKSGTYTMSVGGTPVTNSTTLNGLNIFEFDGNGEYLQSTTYEAVASNGNHWVIGVFRYDGTDSTQDSFWSFETNQSPKRDYAISSGANNNTWPGELDMDALSSGRISSTIGNKLDWTGLGGLNITQWYIVACYFNKTGNQIGLRFDGRTNSFSPVNDYDNSISTNQELRLMRNRSSQELNGKMAEFFVVADLPGTSGTDMSTIEKAEGYLAHKWGRTGALPVGHPYKNSAP